MAEITRIPNDANHALILLKGEEGREWNFLPIDEVEWSDPYYCHQN